MCHQSIGLIARHIEQAGFPTISFSSAWSITASANPPRAVFVDAPLGHTTGAPNKPDQQRELLLAGLSAGVAMTSPGTIMPLDYRWHDDQWRSDPLSWSRARQDSGTLEEPAGDTRTGRADTPTYQSEADRLAAEAVPEDQQCLVCLGTN